METQDFEKLIGKNVYVIWDFTCAFFKSKGNGVYSVLDARDDYVHLSKTGETRSFWALCDQIEEAKEHLIAEEPNEEDVQFDFVPLKIVKSVDTTYIETGKIEPRAFGLDLETDDSVNANVYFDGSEFEFLTIPPLADKEPIIQPKVARPKRIRPYKPRPKKEVSAAPKEKKPPRKRKRPSAAYKTKPRIKQKDGIFMCHFGVKYVPGICAIGRGETIEDAYKAWRAANDKLMAIKAERKAQKAANGGINAAN